MNTKTKPEALNLVTQVPGEDLVVAILIICRVTNTETAPDGQDRMYQAQCVTKAERDEIEAELADHSGEKAFDSVVYAVELDEEQQRALKVAHDNHTLSIHLGMMAVAYANALGSHDDEDHHVCGGRCLVRSEPPSRPNIDKVHSTTADTQPWQPPMRQDSAQRGSADDHRD